MTPERHLLGDGLGGAPNGLRVDGGCRGKDVSVQETMWRVVAPLGAGPRRPPRSGAGRARRGGRPAHEEPPTNPAARSVPLARRLIWAISVAVGAAVARVVAERGAATAWEAATGSPPPGLET